MDGEDIKAMRILYGYSQEKLAQEIGYTTTSVRNWEHGRTKPGRYGNHVLEEFRRKHEERDI